MDLITISTLVSIVLLVVLVITIYKSNAKTETLWKNYSDEKEKYNQLERVSSKNVISLNTKILELNNTIGKLEDSLQDCKFSENTVQQELNRCKDLKDFMLIVVNLNKVEYKKLLDFVQTLKLSKANQTLFEEAIKDIDLGEHEGTLEEYKATLSKDILINVNFDKVLKFIEENKK
jgi:cell division protein FtsL